MDDNFGFHAKAVAAGNPAIGLWTRAGSWAAQQLTDGFIPDLMLPSLGTQQQAQRLVAVGLWHREEGGYRFHEWTERQPSKGDVEAERAAARDRMRRARAAKKGVPQPQSPQVNGTRSEDVRANFGRSSEEVRVTPVRVTPTQSQSQSQPDPVVVTAVAVRDDTAREASAQTIVAEWIEHCEHRPPGRVIGQVAKELKTMLDEGIAPVRIRDGLAEWNRKGLHPSALASVVHEVGNRRPVSTKQQETNDLFERAARRMGVIQ